MNVSLNCGGRGPLRDDRSALESAAAYGQTFASTRPSSVSRDPTAAL
jgi:hypothetical protein